MTKEEIFERLWDDYANQNPSVNKIHELFIDQGEEIVNDHIAIRTVNDTKINVDVVSKIFLKEDYRFVSEYRFEDKHLYARHFEHRTDQNAPHIFISELILEECSNFLQLAIKNTINQMSSHMMWSKNLIFSGIAWNPSYRIYEKIREESEFAAWFYVFGFRANHFTISVNHFKKYDTIEKVNNLLKENGFLLNESGGDVKGSPGELLEQSSTMADIIPVDFKEGTYNVPGCYYEFAKRYPDKRGKLFSGFKTKSADKIMESTDFYEK